MSDLGLRARVERLLRKDFRTDDLTRLFLYARDRCEGREAVQEIGDFVAHQAERTKGIVTRSTRDWHITAWVHFLVLQRALNPKRLPEVFPEFLHASLRRLDPKIIKKNTGLNVVDAKRLLGGVIRKFVKNDDRTVSLAPSHNRKELMLVESLTQYLVAKPAFDHKKLFSGFSATLKSHGLLTKSELKKFEDLEAAVGLFALTVMHNCVIDIDGKSKISLTASDDIAPIRKLGVTAAVPVVLYSGGSVLPAGAAVQIPGRTEQVMMLSSAIFSTDLEAPDHCTPELLATPKPWNTALEVTNDMRLGLLT